MCTDILVPEDFGSVFSVMRFIASAKRQRESGNSSHEFQLNGALMASIGRLRPSNEEGISAQKAMETTSYYKRWELRLYVDPGDDDS